jgi:hypothetical protein
LLFPSNFLISLQLTLLVNASSLTGLSRWYLAGIGKRENRPLIDFKPPVFRGPL